MTNVKFFRLVLAPSLRLFTVILVLNILWSIFVSLQSFTIKLILDKSTELNHSLSLSLEKLLFILFIITCFIRINFIVYDKISLIYLYPQVKKNIKLTLFKVILEHSQAYHKSNFAGSITSKVNNVAEGITAIVPLIIERFLGTSILLVSSLITLTTVHYKYSLILLLWSIIFTLMSYYLAYEAKYLSMLSAEVKARITGLFIDVLTNITSVKLFANEEFEINKMTQKIDDSLRCDKERDLFFIKAHIYKGSTFLILYSLCIILLMIDFKKQRITPGDFSLVITVNFFLADFFWNLSKNFRQFMEYFGNINEGLTTFYTKTEIVDKPNASKLIIKKGDIILDKICFSYNNSSMLFNNLTLKIDSGTKVGLVGFSGAGKTTLLNLILRLYEVHTGNILIGGYNVQDITQESLRSSISIISQEPILFHRSIKENIKYGKLNATDDDIVEAAVKACAHEFIEKLPGKYDSLVGERGVRLSGGEKQRIVIARAILKNAPILFLDEATSNLDSITEKNFQNALWKLMQNKTVIIIAHRISTVLNLDRILVFNNGCIVEDGTHNQLLSNNKVYKSLWDTQINGFLISK